MDRNYRPDQHTGETDGSWMAVMLPRRERLITITTEMIFMSPHQILENSDVIGGLFFLIAGRISGIMGEVSEHYLTLHL